MPNMANMDTLDILMRIFYNQSARRYSDFHKNRVRYNMYSTNEANSINVII